MLEKLNVEEYRTTAKRIWKKCEELLFVPIIADLCLLVGLGPMGKADNVEGRQTVFLPLDLSLDKRYEIAAAHEIFHIGRDTTLTGRESRHPTLLDLTINEGMAVAFSLIVCPGNDFKDALFWLKDEDIEWMKTNESRLTEELSEVWHKPATPELTEKYLWDPPNRKADIPPQTAYFIGYKICQRALFSHDIRYLVSRTAREVFDLTKM